MRVIAELFMLAGGLIALLAGVGLIRFKTAYARFHAAGKASPIAFMVSAIGASLALGGVGAGYLLVTTLAMILTLPVGVHLLFRAVHHASGRAHLLVDQLDIDEHR